MSQAHLDVARRAVETWNAGDIEAMAALFAPDAEFLPFRSQLEGIVYRGPEGVRQFSRDAAEEWEVLLIEIVEFRDAGAGRVLLLGRMKGRGRASGMDLLVPAAWVMHFDGGMIVRLRAYSKHEDALDAVGMS